VAASKLIYSKGATHTLGITLCQDILLLLGKCSSVLTEMGNFLQEIQSCT